MTIKRLKKILYKPFCFVGSHTYERRFRGLTTDYVYQCEICSDVIAVHPSTFFRSTVDEGEFLRLLHMEIIIESRFVLLEIIRTPNPIDTDGLKRPRRRVSARRYLIRKDAEAKYNQDLHRIRIKSMKDFYTKKVYEKYIM